VLAVGDITEVPATAVAEVEPEPELTLDLAASEGPAAETEPMSVEEIPFISEEEPGLPRHEEGEVAPALDGLVEESGPARMETPEDLAERLDFFFGEGEETEEGPAEDAAGGEAVSVEEAVPTEASPLEEENPAPTALTPEQYEAGQRQLEERLRRDLDSALAARETGKLALLENELTSVCMKRAALSASLDRYQGVLAELEGVVPEISATLPGFQAETVRQSLRGGDVEVARALLTETVQQLAATAPLAARTRFWCGRLAEEQAEFAAAGELYRQACAGEEQKPDFLYAAGRMARILGNDEEARVRLEALLATDGEDEVHDLARHELARIYLRLEQKDQAEPLLAQALAGLEQRLGADHPALGPVLHDLAALHESSGRYEQAEPLYRRALAVSEQGLGLEHPQLAATLGKLAGLYEEMEQEDQAEPLYERALAIRQRVLGSGHPDIGILLNYLANLLKQRGEYGKAEPMFLSALEIAEKALGSDHPNLTVILNNLAELYEETGNEEKAQHYQERAFALFELPGAGGDFVEMEKDEIAIDDEKDTTIAGS
jgi:tetratricopeptide (TPR) repeat protein